MDNPYYYPIAFLSASIFIVLLFTGIETITETLLLTLTKLKYKHKEPSTTNKVDVPPTDTHKQDQMTFVMDDEGHCYKARKESSDGTVQELYFDDINKDHPTKLIQYNPDSSKEETVRTIKGFTTIKSKGTWSKMCFVSSDGNTHKTKEVSADGMIKEVHVVGSVLYELVQPKDGESKIIESHMDSGFKRQIIYSAVGSRTEVTSVPGLPTERCIFKDDQLISKHIFGASEGADHDGCVERLVLF